MKSGAATPRGSHAVMTEPADPRVVWPGHHAPSRPPGHLAHTLSSPSCGVLSSVQCLTAGLSAWWSRVATPWTPSPRGSDSMWERRSGCSDAAGAGGRRWGVCTVRNSSQRVILSLVVLCLLPLVSAFCPSACECDDSKLAVNCQNASLEVVPILLNPRVQTISLTRNRIKSLASALVFYTDLRELDISHNQIDRLGAKNFVSQKNLAELRLGHNQLGEVGALAFEGLVGVRVLMLNNNHISTIEGDAFKDLVSLIELNLSNNKLYRLGEGTFRALPNLWTLSVAGNSLSAVPSATLADLTSLIELDLSDNQISQVPEAAFSGAPTLGQLRLDRNNISAVSGDAFTGLPQLRRLDLVDNRLEDVPTHAFLALHTLHDLDLSGNLFEELPEDGLRGLTSLRSLTMSRCPRLNRISGEAFLSTSQLQALVLSHNPRLASLPQATLASLLHLNHLDLRACGLAHITPSQVPLQHLESLLVSGNPLHCNCSLVWLSRITADDNASVSVDEPTCASPPTLYGVSLRDIGDGGSGCDGTVGVWTIVICVGVGVAGLAIIAIFLWCLLRRSREKKRRKRILQDKIPWGEVWRTGGDLHGTAPRLPNTTHLPTSTHLPNSIHLSQPMNGDSLSSYPLTSPSRLRLGPPHLTRDHPLHNSLHNSLQHQHHQGCLQHCPYATLHPAYLPLLHPAATATHESPNRFRTHPRLSHAGPTVMPLGPPPPIPAMEDPPHWYATIGGCDDDDEDDDDKRRETSPLKGPDVATPTPRKVPVTYV